MIEHFLLSIFMKKRDNEQSLLKSVMIRGLSAILEEIADIINAMVICLKNKSVISCVDYMNK